MKVDCPAAQVVRRAYARVDACRTMPISAALGRHKAADLRHDDNERHLPHICGFTRHIRARNDRRRGSHPRSSVECRSAQTARCPSAAPPPPGAGCPLNISLPFAVMSRARVARSAQIPPQTMPKHPAPQSPSPSPARGSAARGNRPAHFVQTACPQAQ